MKDTYYMEQVVNKDYPDSYWFYCWHSVQSLEDLRSASERTATFCRPVAYFRIKLKPKP